MTSAQTRSMFLIREMSASRNMYWPLGLRVWSWERVGAKADWERPIMMACGWDVCLTKDSRVAFPMPFVAPVKIAVVGFLEVGVVLSEVLAERISWREGMVCSTVSIFGFYGLLWEVR